MALAENRVSGSTRITVRAKPEKSEIEGEAPITIRVQTPRGTNIRRVQNSVTIALDWNAALELADALSDVVRAVAFDVDEEGSRWGRTSTTKPWPSSNPRI